MKTESNVRATEIWGRFADRAAALKPLGTQMCSCPPNDWTVNVKGRPG